jgi:hypothetical protein
VTTDLRDKAVAAIGFRTGPIENNRRHIALGTPKVFASLVLRAKRGGTVAAATPQRVGKVTRLCRLVSARSAMFCHRPLGCLLANPFGVELSLPPGAWGLECRSATSAGRRSCNEYGALR